MDCLRWPRYACAVLQAVSQRVAFARDIAHQAGQVLKRWADEIEMLKVSSKGLPIDLVTEADRESERLIATGIAERFPQDGILGEEGATRARESGFRWVIDPLDGTTNFVHGLPHYMVSIGLEYLGQTVGAALYGPALDERFYAIRGGGAYYGEQPIAVSATTELSGALLATGFPYNRRVVVSEILPQVQRALQLSRGLRRCGSAAYDLCNIARGYLDGYFEQGLKPWDTVAGALMVEEAGGTLTHYDGSDYENFTGYQSEAVTPTIVAANPILHPNLLRHIVQPHRAAGAGGPDAAF